MSYKLSCISGHLCKKFSYHLMMTLKRFQPRFFIKLRSNETEEIEFCMKVFSIKDDSLDSSLTFDESLIDSLMSELSGLGKMQVLSLLYDFPNVLSLECKSYIGCLRKLFAVGFCAPQLLKQRVFDFVSEIPFLIRVVIDNFEANKDLQVSACSAVVYAVYAISRDYRERDEMDSLYFNVLKTSLEFFNIASDMSPNSMRMFRLFFLSSLSCFHPEDAMPDDSLQVFRAILNILENGIESTDQFNHVAIFEHLLKFLPIGIDRDVRERVFSLIMKIAEIFTFVLPSIMESECRILYIRYVGAYISGLVDSSGLIYDCSAIDGDPKVDLAEESCSFYQTLTVPTLTETVPLLKDDERDFDKSLPKSPLPSLYTSISLTPPIRSLLDATIKLCLLDKRTSGLLLTQMLLRPSSPSIFFFVAFFLKDYPLFSQLEESGILEKMMELAFQTFRYKQMITYICELFPYLIESIENDSKFLSALLVYVDKSMYEFQVNDDLIDCVCLCARIAPSRMAAAAESVQFEYLVARLFLSMRNRHIAAINKGLDDKSLSCIRAARMACFRLVDTMISIPMIRDKFFKCSVYGNVVLEMLVEKPLEDYLIYQLYMMLSTLKAVDFALVELFAGFSIKFQQSHDLRIQLLVVNVIARASVSNCEEIAKVFLNTRFFDVIISFVEKIGDRSAVYTLIDIFGRFSELQGEIKWRISALDIFSKLYPIFKPFFEMGQSDEELLSRLRNIIFRNGLDSISNAGPLPLLFKLMKNNTESLMHLVQLLISICTRDTESCLETSASELTSNLIEYLACYRSGRPRDELFDSLVDLITILFLRSVKGKDLVLYLRNLAAIDEELRPFFTGDICRSIKLVLGYPPEEVPSFVRTYGENSGVELLSSYHIGVLKQFFVFMDIKFLDEQNDSPGILLWISDSLGNALCLSYHMKQLSVRLLVNGHEKWTQLFKYPFVPYQWTRIALQYSTKRKLQLFVHGKEVEQSILPAPGLVLKDILTLCNLAASVRCDIGQVFIAKCALDDDMIRTIANLPRTFVTSLMEAEADDFPIEYRRLFTLHKHFIVYFNPAVSYHGGLVNLASSHVVMPTQGIVFGYSSQAKSIMHTVGGVQALLPLFDQLDLPQQHVDDDREHSEPLLMSSLIELLRSALSESLTNQEEFGLDEGFLSLGFLLANRVSKRHFSLESMKELELLLRAMDDADLKKQMIRYVLHNQSIWSYLPLDIQTIALRILGDYYKNNPGNFPVSDIVHLMKVSLCETSTDDSVCLLRSPKKDPVTGEELVRQPNDIRAIREQHWKLIRGIGPSELTVKDVCGMIPLCFDLTDMTFACEILSFFTFCLESEKACPANLLQGLVQEHGFKSFFSLLRPLDKWTADAMADKLQCHVFRFFLNIMRGKWDQQNQLLAPFTVKEWIIVLAATLKDHINGLDGLIYSWFLDLSSQVAPDGKVQHQLSCPELLPIFMLSISTLEDEIVCQYLTSFRESLRFNKEPILSLSNWDYPFLAFLVNRTPDPSTDFDCSSRLCLDILIWLSSGVYDLLRMRTWFDYWSCRSGCDLSHVLRKILGSFILMCSLASSDNSSIRTEYSMCREIFQFLFFLTEGDSFYHPHFSSSAQSPNTRVTFGRLYQLLIDPQEIVLNYTYGTRTTHDGQWLDADLADSFLGLLSCRASLFCAKPQIDIGKNGFHPLFMFSFCLAIGLQHSCCYSQFTKYLTRLLSLIGSEQRSDSTLLSCAHTAFAGLVKRVCGFYPNEEAWNFLYDQLKSHEDFLFGRMGDPPVKLESREVFRDSALSQHNVLLRLLTAFSENEDMMREANDAFAKVANKELRRMIKLGDRFVLNARMLLDDTKNQLEDKQDQTRSDLLGFVSSIRSDDVRARKRYRDLFRSLSDDGGPWCPPDGASCHHYKLSTLFGDGYKRNIFQKNFDFDDHQSASIPDNRDGKAQSRYAEARRRSRSKTFDGDQFERSFDNDDPGNQPDLADERYKIVLTLPAKLVTMNCVYSGKFLLSKNAVFFTGQTKYLRLEASDIRHVRLRIYLLIDNAIEVFTAQRAYFFVFQESERQKVLRWMKRYNYMNVQLNESDVQKDLNSVTSAWEKGEMSNFDYLMAVNVLAGRTYNDLAQYPVFPWVLKDYSSEELDLHNPDSYRDLSKPVGALGAERLITLLERMGSDEETHYLYGSLYSSPAVVMGYLIRIEPFTSLHIQLQGNKFDISDRLFKSIPEAWNSVQNTLMDFRELIPEFFYLPDFLVNSNSFNLGKDCNDVVLPTWARSPTDFIVKHRAALESPHVTAQLPKWIDLIFGVNSRGLSAVDCMNAYCPYFFESAFAKFPERKDFIQDFVVCFGQAASKIFFKPHPQQSATRTRIDKRVPVLTRLDNLGSPVIALESCNGTKCAVTESFEVRDLDRKRKVCDLLHPVQLEPEDRRKLSSLIAMNGKLCIFAFPYDFAFYVYDIEKGHLMKVKRFHTREIAAIIAGDSFYATASNDSTVVVWNRSIHRPHFILSKHKSAIACIAMNETCDMLVSCSKDRSIIASSLREGRYLRGTTAVGDPCHVSLSSAGTICVVSEDRNGTHLEIFDRNMNHVCQGQSKPGVVNMKIIEEIDGSEWLLIMLETGSLVLKSASSLDTVWQKQFPGVITMTFVPEMSHLLLGYANGDVSCLSFSLPTKT